MSDSQLIGKGRYGCVYKPPIPCKYLHNLDKKYKNDVMKIADMSLLVNVKEEEISLRIREIDPGLTYFVPSTGDKCLLDEDDESLLECPAFVKKKRHQLYRGIYIKYGGITLREYLYKYQVDVSTTWTWMQHLAKGIKLLHDNGIVHLDIKPDNIVVDDEMNLRIIDFGLSQFVQEYDIDDLVKFY